MKLNRTLLRFALEVAVYALLVTVYLALILTWFAAPLAALAHSDLPQYALVALALVVLQGIVLENVTTFLIDRLDIE